MSTTKILNSILIRTAALVFCALVAAAYAFVVCLNPVLPLNIVIWVLFCFASYRMFEQFKLRDPKVNSLWIAFISVLMIYIIFGVKSSYFVAYYNELYLTGQSVALPEGITENTFLTLLAIDVYVDKLQFMLGWDTISFSAGSKLSVHLKPFLSNVIRLLEILGFLFSTYIFRKVAAKFPRIRP